MGKLLYLAILLAFVLSFAHPQSWVWILTHDSSCFLWRLVCFPYLYLSNCHQAALFGIVPDYRIRDYSSCNCRIFSFYSFLFSHLQVFFPLRSLRKGFRVYLPTVHISAHSSFVRLYFFLILFKFFFIFFCFLFHIFYFLFLPYVLCLFLSSSLIVTAFFRCRANIVLLQRWLESIARNCCCCCCCRIYILLVASLPHSCQFSQVLQQSFPLACVAIWVHVRPLVS